MKAKIFKSDYGNHYVVWFQDDPMWRSPYQACPNFESVQEALDWLDKFYPEVECSRQVEE